MTPEQIAGNRANALKSTGPKTAAGKAVSRCNALKHAQFAQKIVVCGHQFKESSDDFKQLCRQFYARLRPVGPLEEILVDQIIQATWRLRRSYTAEAGDIALNVDLGYWERQRPQPKLKRALWENSLDPVWEMENYSGGITRLLGWLHEIRKLVETEGELSAAALKIPMNGRPNGLSDELVHWRNKYAPADDTPAARAEANERFLAYLDRRIHQLYRREEECEDHEESLEQSLQSSAVLPDARHLDRILRYQTAVERQLYRAMTQLEKLQGNRRSKPGTDAETETETDLELEPEPATGATTPNPNMENYGTNPNHNSYNQHETN